MPRCTDGGFDEIDPHLPKRNEDLSGQRQTPAGSTADDNVSEKYRIEIFGEPPGAYVHQNGQVGNDNKKYAKPNRRFAKGENRSGQQEYHAGAEQVNV